MFDQDEVSCQRLPGYGLKTAGAEGPGLPVRRARDPDPCISSRIYRVH